MKASDIFPTFSLLQAMVATMVTIPVAVVAFVQAGLSLKRLDRFFSLEERGEGERKRQSLARGDDVLIKISDGSFAWQEEDCLVPTPPVLRRVNFEAKRGQLIGIIGKVGASKSSLLAAILGELHKIKGKATKNIISSLIFVFRRNSSFGEEYRLSSTKSLDTECNCARKYYFWSSL